MAVIQLSFASHLALPLDVGLLSVHNKPVYSAISTKSQRYVVGMNTKDTTRKYELRSKLCIQLDHTLLLIVILVILVKY